MGYWVRKPFVPVGVLDIDVSGIPAMARRRLGYLAKMAVSVADQALTGEMNCAEIPVVWASRYGDAQKSLALLAEHAGNQLLSPTAFALSVHNGVGSQHSILRHIQANAVCIAASEALPEVAMLEAIGLLDAGANQVLLVCYDEALPQAYAQFQHENRIDAAWAVLLERPQQGELAYTIQLTQGKADERSSSLSLEDELQLPHSLEVLYFLLSATPGQMTFQNQSDGGWRWGCVRA